LVSDRRFAVAPSFVPTPDHVLRGLCRVGPGLARPASTATVCSKLEVTKMDAQILSANREPGIWARLMQNPGGELLPEAAEYLLSIRFADSDVDRMRQLAERSETGELTDEERAEFDSYLHVGNLLAVIQSKARLALRRR